MANSKHDHILHNPRKRMRLRSDKEIDNLHILTLPILAQDNILSFLTLREQLRLRLVCKASKMWIDQSSNRLAEHIPNSILQNHGPNSFKVFTSRRIPHVITSIHLVDDTLAVFDDPLMPAFLKKHGFLITSVRLKRYFICNNCQNQSTFFEALTNLRALVLDEVWIANVDDITLSVPETVQTVSSLKFGRVKVYNEPTYEVIESGEDIPIDRQKILRWQVWNILDSCLELDHLRVPISPKFLIDNVFDECFRLLNYIRIRTCEFRLRQEFRDKSCIMHCDINNFACCTSSLEVLLIVGARMKIRFHNVNSKIFRRGSNFCIIGHPQYSRFEFIQSFVSSSLVNRAFEYVQKLTFKASLIQNECIIGRDKGPGLFPNLKEFTIILDIGCDTSFPTALYSRQPNSTQARNVCLPRAEQMLLFFFPNNMAYKFVHTASIIIQDPVFENQKKIQPDKLMSLPKITKCFPSLRALTLSGLNCKRNTYFSLWHGFPMLEKLSLENCPSLNASCFIDGNGNPNNPENFQFLTELRFLELKGLEKMPGVAWNGKVKPQVAATFIRMRLVPSQFLKRNELGSRNVVWVRSLDLRDPFSYISSSSIVTRSTSAALKRNHY